MAGGAGAAGGLKATLETVLVDESSFIDPTDGNIERNSTMTMRGALFWFLMLKRQLIRQYDRLRAEIEALQREIETQGDCLQGVQMQG